MISTSARIAVAFGCGGVLVDQFVVSLGDDGLSGTGAANLATFYVEFSQLIERFTLGNSVIRGLIKATGAS